MGGGGPTRAAAAARWRRTTHSSIPPPAEHSVRSASRPVSAINSSSTAAHGGIETVGHQLDDCEFTSADKELLIFDSAAAAAEPRVVFGAAPSLSEAKAATDDLKDAIEKVFRIPDCLEASGCITSQSTATLSHAVKCFTLLNKSPAVQSVVASIACDPNVWEAVLKNEAITSFFKTQKNYAEFCGPDSPRKSHDLSEDVGSSGKLTDLSDKSSISENAKSRLINTLGKIKNAVVERAANVSSFVQNRFSTSFVENVSDSATDGKAKLSFMDNILLGSPFMALALMVIMMVVLKRPW